MKYCLIVLLFSFIFAAAQDYTPLDSSDYSTRKAKKQEYIDNYQNFIDFIKNKYSGKIKKELSSNFEGFMEGFSEKFDEKEFVFDSPFNSKIEEIYTEIYSHNPQVPSNFMVLVSRNNSLNAYCMPDGTMVVHVGAIYLLDNEDQLAYVLCHEIAHKILEHPLNHTIERIEEDNSREAKKAIKSLRKEYNRGEKAFELLKSKLYAQGDKKRKNELQADSLGYILLTKTKYAKSEAKRGLELLLEYDTISPKGVSSEVYERVFNLPNMPFKKEWLVGEDFSQYDYSLFDDKLDEDSIKSHPEIEERIAKLIQLFPELKKEVTTKEATQSFKDIQTIAKNEQVPNLFYQEEYGLAIYYALYRIQQDYLSQYHKKWLGPCFEKIYESRKNYTTNRYLDRVVPEDQSESYQQFLGFMWNLRLDEIKAFADYFNGL